MLLHLQITPLTRRGNAVYRANDTYPLTGCALFELYFAALIYLQNKIRNKNIINHSYYSIASHIDGNSLQREAENGISGRRVPELAGSEEPRCGSMICQQRGEQNEYAQEKRSYG